jgi:hypothetical protein
MGLMVRLTQQLGVASWEGLWFGIYDCRKTKHGGKVETYSADYRTG